MNSLPTIPTGALIYVWKPKTKSVELISDVSFQELVKILGKNSNHYAYYAHLRNPGFRYVHVVVGDKFASSTTASISVEDFPNEFRLTLTLLGVL